MLKKSLLTILFVFTLTDLASGQWKIVAKNVFSETDQGWGGALTYKDGLLWYGTNFLWVSQDTGLTWNKLPLKIESNRVIDWIDVIDFYNKDLGIVGTEYGDLFITHDRGQTWNKINSIGASGGATFVGDSLHIMMTQSYRIYSSSDGGRTWQVCFSDTLSHLPIDSVTWFQDVVSVSQGSAVVFGGNTGRGGYIYKTTDFGRHWKRMQGKALPDSYTFSLDSCDRNRIYLVNENDSYLDDSSRIFLSSDAGMSWSPINIKMYPFFCGSIAVAPHSVYCPTVFNGVYRSTDLGVNWKSIGGPVTRTDTRRIAAINDNIIIATDTGGSVWRTDNSGGDSVVYSAPQLSLSSSNQKTDSIGGLVRVPIVVSNPSQYSLLQYILQFSDTTRLLYLGTYSKSGKSVDVTDERLLTQSKIQFLREDLSISSDTIGFAVFRVSPKQEQPCADISIDSITYITEQNECSFLSSPPIIVNLCSCLGCPLASVYPNNNPYGDDPNVSIFPNPTTNRLVLTCDKNLGTIKAEVSDILGHILIQDFRQVYQGVEIAFDVQSIPAGSYILRLSGFGFKKSYSFIRE